MEVISDCRDPKRISYHIVVVVVCAFGRVDRLIAVNVDIAVIVAVSGAERRRRYDEQNFTAASFRTGLCSRQRTSSTARRML